MLSNWYRAEKIAGNLPRNRITSIQTCVFDEGQSRLVHKVPLCRISYNNMEPFKYGFKLQGISNNQSMEVEQEHKEPLPEETPTTGRTDQLQEAKQPEVQNDNNQNTQPPNKEVDEVAKKLEEIDLQQGSKQNQRGGEAPAEQEQDEEQEEFYTRDLIEVTRSNINFNRNILFPGSIDEIELIISLKDEYFAEVESTATYRLKVVALCSEAKFNDLDEYVFSVRRSQRFEYFEEVHFHIQKDDKAQVRVAVKVPAVKQTQLIEGTLSIQLADTFPVYLPISAKCEIPQIVCLKELFDENQGVTLIKIPGKKGNMRMPPIPFKNASSFNFLLEVETVSHHDMSQRLYDIVNTNSQINCSANAPFFVTLQLKPNLSYKGAIPQTQTIRKVIILKVKNASLCFSYPIEVYIYESSNVSNVS